MIPAGLRPSAGGRAFCDNRTDLLLCAPLPRAGLRGCVGFGDSVAVSAAVLIVVSAATSGIAAEGGVGGRRGTERSQVPLTQQATAATVAEGTETITGERGRGRGRGERERGGGEACLIIDTKCDLVRLCFMRVIMNHFVFWKNGDHESYMCPSIHKLGGG